MIQKCTEAQRAQLSTWKEAWGKPSSRSCRMGRLEPSEQERFGGAGQGPAQGSVWADSVASLHEYLHLSPLGHLGITFQTMRTNDLKLMRR